MIYTATQINESPTIVAKAGAAVSAEKDFRGKVVKFDESGDVVLASSAGEAGIGIAIMTNGETNIAGDDITIQIKDIGVALAGGKIAAGDALAADAEGKLQKATAGQFVMATALEAAAAAGKYIRVAINKYATPSA